MQEPVLNSHNKEEYPPMHTAEHILNATMVKMFGCPRSRNAHIERKKSKCDYILERCPDDSQTALIERMVNEVIDSDLEVSAVYMTREEAASLVDLSKLPPDASETLRIVKIGDYDACACIGAHVSRTSEIGPFKILSHSFDNGIWRVRWKVTPPDAATSSRPKPHTIYLAGGCFWGLEKYFKLIRGVTATEVGFVNGHTANPTYKEVYTDTTGYAECVKVTFDPAVLSLEKLLEFYFKAIDPTSENRQGEDTGTRYRCGIFHSPDSPADMAAIKDIHDRKEKEFGRIFVETGPMVSYTPAEEYHQDYLQKNPGGYCHLKPELYKFAAEVNK